VIILSLFLFDKKKAGRAKFEKILLEAPMDGGSTSSNTWITRILQPFLKDGFIISFLRRFFSTLFFVYADTTSIPEPAPTFGYTPAKKPTLKSKQIYSHPDYSISVLNEMVRPLQ
jgi:hypothetical protein